MTTRRIKTILAITAFLFLAAPFFITAETYETAPEINFFWTTGCSYCDQQKVFFKELQKDYPEIVINQYSVGASRNVELLRDLTSRHLGSERYFGSVPITFFNGQFFVGFDENTGRRIEKLVAEYFQVLERDEEENDKEDVDELFSLPVIGQINPQDWSLGALAVVIGTVDGFNVCSLGALILILVLVISLKSRKATLILGSVFVVVTVIIYGVFVFLWHHLFSLFAPYMATVKIVIGIAALLGGLYFIRQFLKFRKEGPVCESSNNKIIAAATKKVEKAFKERKNLWVLLVAIVFFAALVAIIEFPCSAVFPIIFTGILSQAELPFPVSAFYILLYLFFYMLDEIIVFLVAVFTRDIWIASGKFMTAMSIVGAIVLLFLSYQYLFVG